VKMLISIAMLNKMYEHDKDIGWRPS